MLYIIIKIVIVAAMVAFPFVKSPLKGVIEFGLIKGFLIGMNYDCSLFTGKTDEGEDKIYRVHVLQFHLFIVSLSMAFSIEAKDLEIDE